MTEKKIFDEIVDYFKSEQWMRMMNTLNNKEDKANHVHIYIDTNINPWCMEQLLKSYFAKIGHPIHRKIEIFTSGQVSGSGTIHGIEPEGMPHFDMIFRYSKDRAIKPTENRDHNVEYWGDKYMEEFHLKYPFKTKLREDEKSEVEKYFSSDAWKEYCRLNESPEVVHIHANVETSIHPLIIREYALKAMEKQGWKIEYSVPVAFAMRGQMHGKIVFAGIKPEKMFDIAWGYNPVVILIPSTKYWLTTENPTYDARTMHEIPNLLKSNEYILLSIKEMEEVASRF